MASSIINSSGASISSSLITNNNNKTNSYVYTSAYDLYSSVGLFGTPLPGIYTNALGNWWGKGLDQFDVDKFDALSVKISSSKIAKGVTKGP